MCCACVGGRPASLCLAQLVIRTALGMKTAQCRTQARASSGNKEFAQRVIRGRLVWLGELAPNFAIRHADVTVFAVSTAKWTKLLSYREGKCIISKLSYVDIQPPVDFTPRKEHR
jgi:hypothetical protein